MLVLVLAACAQRERGAPPAPDAATPPVASLAAVASSVAAPPAVRVPASTVDAAVAAIPVADWVWKPYRGDRFTLLFPGTPKVPHPTGWIVP